MFQQETLTLPPPRIASEFLTPEEMAFKKVKRKVRKIRKKNVTASDLVPLPTNAEADEDLGNRKQRKRYSLKPDIKTIQCFHICVEISIADDGVRRTESWKRRLKSRKRKTKAVGRRNQWSLSLVRIPFKITSIRVDTK